MTVMLLIWLALGVPMTLWLSYGVRPLSDLLPGAFIALAFWIVLMFVVAGIKRAIVWLWRTLRRRTEPAMEARLVGSRKRNFQKFDE